jgi:predicted permease
MATFLQDLRYGFRMLMRAPGFATVAVLTLALGIGANTAIFTVINAVMLRMLPVRDPGELAVVGNPSRVHSWSNGTPRTDIFSYPLYREIRDRNSVFSSVLASSRIDGVPVTIESGSAQERVESRLVTGNYFETLGLTPAAGRFFTGAEDNTPGGDPVVVISYAYWQRRFSSDPNIVGRTVRLRNYPFTIIGVAPRGFVGEVVGDRHDLWIPMMMQAQLMPGREFLQNPNTATLLLIGRLKPGVSLEQAQANVSSIVRQALTETLASKLSSDDRRAIQNGGINFVPPVSAGGRGLSRVREQFSASLLLLMGLVALVLLVACVNVANLLLARSAARRREIAVRLAIGAAPGRVVRQLLTESLLLAFIGGALGLLFASWGATALVRLVNKDSAIPLALNLDWRVLGFTLAACLLAGLLFGTAPALRVLKLNLAPAIGSGTRESAGSARSLIGRLLIASQIALGVLVLMAAALLVRSLEKLQDTDLGYSRDELVLARVDLFAAGYARGAEFNNATRELLTRLGALPGVRSVSASTNGLFSGSESNDAIRVEGFTAADQKNPDTFDDEVGPNYFSTIGVPIIQGREINQRDYDSGARVLVVNEAFVRFFFGTANPIGRHVVFLDSDHPEHEQPFEIVGLAHDLRDHDIRSGPQRRAYAPLSSAEFDSPGSVNFELRVSGDPAAQIAAIRQQIRSLNPNLRGDVRTAGELVGDTLQSQVLVAKLSAFFGGLVLLLVCVGLYGSMSYNVAGRIKEIGVRMALGARRWDVVWMVTREACYMLAAGIVAGIPAGILAGRLFQALLYEVGKADPISIAAAIITLLAVAVAAAVIPARRATRVDPMIALRYE